MNWTPLPTDYTDAVWTGMKKYNMIQNEDDTVSLQDVTVYSNRDKSFFGAKDANQMNSALNEIAKEINQIANYIYPVGSIYLSTNSTNPSTIFGGTWVEWGSGRVPVGVMSSDSDFSAPNKTGGEKTHTLTRTEMPQHTHTPTVSGRPIGVNSGTTPAWHVQAASDWNIAEVTVTTTSAGGGQPHNNMPPYITCYMWKRTA